MIANSQTKRILIASPFFYPEPISTGKYNTFLAEKLVQKGHDVTVICSYPFYPAWKPEFTRKALAGVKVMRGGLRMVYPKSATIRRLILEAWFAWQGRQTHTEIKNVIIPSDMLYDLSWPPVTRRVRWSRQHHMRG